MRNPSRVFPQSLRLFEQSRLWRSPETGGRGARHIGYEARAYLLMLAISRGELKSPSILGYHVLRYCHNGDPAKREPLGAARELAGMLGAIGGKAGWRHPTPTGGRPPAC